MDSVSLRYTWTHSEIELEGREYNDVRGDMVVPFVLRGGRLPNLDGVRYAYGFLNLDDDRERTDGVYTVAVSYLGEEQFSARFRLENCEGVSESSLQQ